mmetsp:Transcript_3774/g.11169  ORF Transcript_3774/g.11169 Transcript_3774/m.11169 type:complete len:86 (+) Transcript_3774:68-325(+)|eukprot:CAMPEP_0119272704 /NCGR_PEP_ID=MMETSP1329-20130426/8961_1 /TAXON_ID=114041 /ORGANISM="Genus nov. species nov., Strain RCC1024" /LENGTH=85 /DNA_ID=CAMNT_0007272801 /DNA_START=59 /DNA_END=316 /DNA_ORIENTATION=-
MSRLIIALAFLGNAIIRADPSTPTALPTLFPTTPYEEMNCNGTLHRYDGRAACCGDLDSGELDTFLTGLTADAIEDACNTHGYTA